MNTYDIVKELLEALYKIQKEIQPKEEITQSDDIKDLVSALAKAQGEMKPAVFNKINPHFKNRYADFTSCMDACREPLSKNGLAIMQFTATIDTKLHLVTLLSHASGQWIRSAFPLIPKNFDSQGIGAAMTYAKRYCLSSMIGLVSDDDDDDGETADGRGKTPIKKPEPIKQAEPIRISVEQKKELKNIIDECSKDYKNSINKFLKDQYGNESLANLEQKHYERMKKSSLKNREEHFEKQKEQFLISDESESQQKAVGE